MQPNSIRHYFEEELVNNVTQGNRYVILDSHEVIFLRDEYNKSHPLTRRPKLIMVETLES